MPSPLSATTVSPRLGGLARQLAAVVEVARVQAAHRQAAVSQLALDGRSQASGLAATGGRVHDQANGRTHDPSVLSQPARAGPRALRVPKTVEEPLARSGLGAVAPAPADGREHAEHGQNHEQPQQDSGREAQPPEGQRDELDDPQAR